MAKGRSAAYMLSLRRKYGLGEFSKFRRKSTRAGRKSRAKRIVARRKARKTVQSLNFGM